MPMITAQQHESIQKKVMLWLDQVDAWLEVVENREADTLFNLLMDTKEALSELTRYTREEDGA